MVERSIAAARRPRDFNSHFILRPSPPTTLKGETLALVRVMIPSPRFHSPIA